MQDVLSFHPTGNNTSMPSSTDNVHGIDFLRRVDSLLLAAKHASIIADELGLWSGDGDSPDETIGRARAVAELRRMSCSKFDQAATELRALL
jgi:hypothetical protein